VNPRGPSDKLPQLLTPDENGAQEAELERRLSSLDQDRQNGVTWTALKAELEQRCP